MKAVVWCRVEGRAGCSRELLEGMMVTVAEYLYVVQAARLPGVYSVY
jgi:hypothetical protein